MSVARSVLLAASTNAWLRERATRSALVRRSVSRFMPGERLEDALEATRAERAHGIATVLTRLGENVTTLGEAEQVTGHYLDALDRIGAAGLDAQVSIKLTQLGLDLEPAACLANVDKLVERASVRGNFIWIDMESSPYVDPTLSLFRRARERSPRVGVCLQAYLRRTAADLEALLPLAPAIRIVKGAYLEPAAVAFPRKADVDENFYRLCARLMDADVVKRGVHLHIGTHDAALVDRLAALADERRVPPSAYEFAMLYGIQRPLQLRLAKAGRGTRVLISYGDYWFPWYMRRLAERPANVWFVVRSVFA